MCALTLLNYSMFWLAYALTTLEDRYKATNAPSGQFADFIKESGDYDGLLNNLLNQAITRYQQTACLPSGNN